MSSERSLDGFQRYLFIQYGTLARDRLFINKLMKIVVVLPIYITAQETAGSNLILIRQEQKKRSSEEIQNLKNSQLGNTNGHISEIYPFFIMVLLCSRKISTRKVTRRKQVFRTASFTTVTLHA